MSTPLLDEPDATPGYDVEQPHGNAAQRMWSELQQTRWPDAVTVGRYTLSVFAFLLVVLGVVAGVDAWTSQAMFDVFN